MSSEQSNTSATPLEKTETNVLLKVIGFCVALTLVFTGVANLLPQVEGEAPVDKEIDLSSLTPESFAALGEELFMGKGTCTLCHKPPPLGRAPDIQGENMVAIAEERLKDSRYKGEAKSTADYILESMKDPSIYVVKDWGVAGTNDSVSPMPKVHAAPIELSDVEMDAVIAYLQHKDGNDITVKLPTEAPVSDKKAEADSAGTPAPAANAEDAIKKYGCQACHNLLGTKSPVGPSLDDIGSRLDPMQIQESIIDPAAVLAEGFADIMPKDFADKMTVKELKMIVDLLVNNKGDGAVTKTATPKIKKTVVEPAKAEPSETKTSEVESKEEQSTEPATKENEQ
ncbi:MAG: c-type cytochrome [Cocleimonas sp.]|nr:c-type cytochrome [Cocleimonas sp.]